MARKEKLAKTNAMRELERGGIAYEAQTYEDDGSNATGYGVAGGVTLLDRDKAILAPYRLPSTPR